MLNEMGLKIRHRDNANTCKEYTYLYFSLDTASLRFNIANFNIAKHKIVNLNLFFEG